MGVGWASPVGVPCARVRTDAADPSNSDYRSVGLPAQDWSAARSEDAARLAVADTPSGNSVAAGWYPTPDGKQRYWDGEQWTNLPWDEKPDSASPGETPAPRKKRSKRKLIIAGAIAVVVVGSLVAGGIIWKATSDAQAAANAQRAAEVAAEDEVKAKEAAQKRLDSAERAEREDMVEQIEGNITTMAEKHVTDDLVDGPIIDVSCSPLGGGSTDDLTEQTTVFDCFVANKDNDDGTMSGYKYHATMNWSTGEFTYGMGAA